MSLKGEATLLRIFLGSLDKVDGKPLYEHIVFEAKKQGLAGATVLKGAMGFGASSFIHTNKILEISDELPVVVEIIDNQDKVAAFVEKLNPYFEHSKYGGMITTETVNVIIYKGKN